MQHFASLCLGVSVLVAACTVGEDPQDDAVAGDGLDERDKEGTAGDGNELNTLAARVCANGATTKGIDVSYYQGVIDWSAAKADGVEFAFIRVSDGAVFRDPKFAQNWSGARAAGVIRGAYQFFRPAQNVAEQAQIMISALGTYQAGDLPPVIDVEATGSLAPAAIASKVRQWVDTVKTATGVLPIVYTGKYFWRDEVGSPRSFEPNPLWIAQYTSKCPDIPAPWTRWMFWQHTDRGRVAGIKGNVDLNRFNGSLETLRAFAQVGTPAAATRAAALPFFWQSDGHGSHTFIAQPPAGVTRVEFRVEDYLIGATDTAGGAAQITYQFNVERTARAVEVRGLDANGATAAVGNGLIDSTAAPEVFVDQYGEMTYEIGTEDPSAASVEVTADGFPLTDAETGNQRSPRGIVRYAFTRSGERALRITTRDQYGEVLATVERTLFVR